VGLIADAATAMLTGHLSMSSDLPAIGERDEHSNREKTSFIKVIARKPVENALSTLPSLFVLSRPHRSHSNLTSPDLHRILDRAAS
jgi:hypothetical protein